jgi:hypothetical protein
MSRLSPTEAAEIYGYGYRTGHRGRELVDLRLGAEAQEEFRLGYEQGKEDAANGKPMRE